MMTKPNETTKPNFINYSQADNGLRKQLINTFNLMNHITCPIHIIYLEELIGTPYFEDKVSSIFYRKNNNYDATCLEEINHITFRRILSRWWGVNEEHYEYTKNFFLKYCKKRDLIK
jgi:hypothetical protein